MNGKTPILLHVCCAPCATSCVEQLLDNGRDVHLFFSNSNINSEAEFARRLDCVKSIASHYKIPLQVDAYSHRDWLDDISGLENEPEHGKRCARCFAWNLRRTMTAARKMNNINFTTTLTVSPHKNARQIFAVGKTWPGFESWDFKQHDGFKRSLELSRHFNLYRQSYCGCEFSVI